MQSVPYWYVNPNYYDILSGSTYFIYITANIQNTATVGSTISVSVPTVSNFGWGGSEFAGTNTATAGTTTVGSCPCSQYYSFNGTLSRTSGTAQTYVVPAGCTQLSVQVAGAVGGVGGYYQGKSYGGAGGKTTTTAAVTPGATLHVYVGNVGGSCIYSGAANSGIGGSNSGGGAHGGHASYYEGGGGGGASDIRTSSGVLTSRFAVGAGGGGGSAPFIYTLNQNVGGIGAYGGGAGGGLGKYEGTGSGTGTYNTTECGGPGLLTGGGFAGAGGATAGGLGYGGDCMYYYDGGGGGGGYYGAGGAQNGGACGGSSNAVSVTGVTVSGTTYNDGSNNGAGYIIVTPVAPTAYAVTGGGAVCGSTTVPVGISNSVSGVNYQLYNGATAVGSPAVGTGSAMTVGNASSVGTYSVAAYYGTNTACTYAQTGSVAVTAGTVPAAFTVSGGGTLCSGGLPVSLSGTETGINYQLKLGATNVGTAIAGTGGAISFGSVSGAGTYTVLATNATTTCTNSMTGSAVITVNPLPSLSSASNSGPVCSGNTMTLNANSPSNVTAYSWAGPVAITGASTSSATVPSATTAASGNYTVTVTNGTGTGCSVNYVTSATVNPSPTAFAVTGGGPYCSGAGAPVGLAGSTSGVNYQLRNGAANVGSAVAGTGGAITFGLNGVGTYSVLATTAATSCTGAMTGSATVTTAPMPSLSGGASNNGPICANNTLMLTANGPSNVTGYSWSGPVAVTGSTSAAATVPSVTTSGSGVYTVIINNGTGTGCTAMYTTSATILASSPVYSVTGGGSYCTGGTGVPLGLSNSTPGILYQLYRGSTAIGGTVTGTGAPMSFGMYTTVGTYSVSGANTGTGCVANMSGTPSISVGPVPSVFSVTGGGGYCAGGTGAAVGLASSEAGVSYQLYNGATAIGSFVSGTGSAITFGPQTAGTYSVVANAGSTCATGMTGSATTFTNGLPTAYNVTGGGAYCNGTGGTHIGLDWSNSGTSYQLYMGSSPVGSSVAGVGGAIDFGSITTPGTYSVLATVGSTGCTGAMTGSTTVSINPLPGAFSITGGGAYCAGAAGVTVGLSGSATGINYQLYNGTSTTGSAVAGTGAAISFGTQSAAGTYTVRATNATTGCNGNMTSTATVTINSLPTQFVVTGGGAYCNGGSGVHIFLSGSTTGVNYQLYNGATTVGTPVAGNGSSLDFGFVTAAGTYSVMATNATTACMRGQSGSAAVTINSSPSAFAVTGGGNYCSGGAGVAVGLGNSISGTTYQLYNGATTVGSPVSGTGSAIGFGSQTAAGTYSVMATNGATGCTGAMTGTVTVGINTLPNAYALTGGGNYCSGGTGVTIGVGNSNSGITYQLYNGSTTVGTAVAGTGSAISFGLQTAAGTYSVLATNTTTTCTNAMSSTATVVVNALPTVFNVTGGGQYCSGGTGVTVGLSNSTSGVNYQLYNGSTTVGSPVSGFGSSIGFGLQTSAGTYTVRATDATTTCTVNMTGSAMVSVNALPTAFTVTGGGNYCSGGTGVTVGLGGSTSGVSYQLFNGSATAGAAVAGTGGSISFGSQTAAGTYSVSAVTTATGCTSNMSGVVNVGVNPSPVSYTVTGGGQYCAGSTGVSVGLSGSNTGTTYQLYNGPSVVSTASGTGAALSFGTITTAGTYTVLATNTSNSCTTGQTGAAVVVVNAVPTVYTVSGGGNYCAGGTGMAVFLNNSTLGINYQLYRGSTPAGSPVAGSGSAINFGLQTIAGTYSVSATNATTGCASNMSGTAAVVANPTPTVYTITGGGQYCAGGTGVSIGLAGSNTGISYQLYNGAAAVGSPLAGTGLALDFGMMTAGGTYMVQASNTTTGCTSNMSGGATVTVNANPTVYTITGGGQYCSGGTGVSIGLSNSSTGISYQLYNGAIPSGAPVSGSGLPLDFGLKTAAGTYSVIAINPSTSCISGMLGTAAITVNANPTVYTVTGGGQYCSGGTGVAIGVSGSAVGVSYQLYNGSAVAGAPVSGTGGTLSFGMFTTAGTYSVAATNTSSSCMSNMSGTATVSVNANPTVYTMTGGGSYCQGGTGVATGLSGSALGVNYQLYSGVTTIGGPISGTGGAISFGNQTAAGTYYAMATNASTTCTANMAGTAGVTINALPTAYTVTGGGNYCSGGTGMNVGL
ncbi:MAG: hypothetical protein V4649_20020, partial [Bacteroidota bacterium]